MRTVIVASAWFTPDHCGVVAPRALSFERSSPSIGNTEEMLEFIGRPVKYYARMTPESRCALGAAHLALEATTWRKHAAPEIGLIAAGYEGSLQANKNYFRDYLASGRSMGRGNLFIYTLPTSALGEVAIALTLTGPSLHLHDDTNPIIAMIKHAEQLVSDGEAEGMLCLWSDPQAAVGIAVGAGDSQTSVPHLPPLFSGGPHRRVPIPTPLELSTTLQRFSRNP